MNDLPLTSPDHAPSRPRPRWAWLVAFSVLSIAALVSWRYWTTSGSGQAAVVTATVAGEVTAAKTVLFRTPGGLLEVAGLKRAEEFKKEVSSWRGHSVSNVQLEATYRYSVALPAELSVSMDHNVARVVMPNYQPELPVAFDTDSLKEKADEGWLRFDGKELLGSLKQDLSKQLTEKASSEVYRTLARETARRTLQEFIMLHIIQDKKWLEDPNRILEVKFQDEVNLSDKPL